jgi:hypothetical protein
LQKEGGGDAEQADAKGKGSAGPPRAPGNGFPTTTIPGLTAKPGFLEW